MARIHRLPLHLANQIAAGEVVERPASVVKELVENALDAGATRIAVAIELGGKKLIRVEDDGEGMEPEDARLADRAARHEQDRAARRSRRDSHARVPRRGAAEHRLGVALRAAHAAPAAPTAAPRCASTAARRRRCARSARREGTCIEVADLFFNLPARRKFLKSDTAESTQISRLVTQLALGYPEVGLSLTSGGRRLLECPPAAGLARALLPAVRRAPGSDRAPQGGGGDLQIHGYVAALGDQGPVRGAQNVFVNRRIVKDRTIAHAISEAYSVATIKERSPEVHLFIEIPPDRVDVNVHPTKAEVRFLEQSLVHEVLRRALADALGRGPAPELQFSPFDGRPGEPQPMTIPGVLAGATIGNRWSPAPYPIDRPIPSAAPAVDPSAWQHRPDGSRWSQPQAGEAGTMQSGSSGAIDTGEMTPDTGEIRPMIPLGQFRDTFIIAIDDEGIAIIDQHVAHERVLFEQVMEKLTAGALESQRLLTPIVLELSPPQRQALAQHAATLERFGLEVEEFGGDSVHAVRRTGAARARRMRSGSPRACRGPRRRRARRARRGRAAADRRDDGVPCRGEGELSADAREDALHPRRAAADGVLERLPARAAGGAAPHPARDREEFPADLSAANAARASRIWRRERAS